MSQYTDLVNAIVQWTKKPFLTGEMDVAIKNAINAAHRLDRFPRDLVSVNLTSVPTTEIQAIDYTLTPFARFRHLGTVEPTGATFGYHIVDVLDLYDLDGYRKTDIVYVIGNMINIRASTPVDAITVRYYQRPNLSNLAALDDWIVADHEDLIILWAAASIFTIINEQEIKTRVEQLAKVAAMNLVADALNSGGQ